MFTYMPTCEYLVSFGLSQSARCQQIVVDHQQALLECFGTDRGEITEFTADDDHDRTDDSRLPWETNGAYGGWGGHEQFETEAGSSYVPVVFVHGNQRDASDWTDTCERFRQEGYRGDELWAITFSEPTTSHAAMSRQLDDFVAGVREYTGAASVVVVAHSLGVTGVRYWLAEYDRYDWVETFVGLAGANHGAPWARLCCTLGFDAGPFAVSDFLRDDYAHLPDHPLAELNADETPGDVDYYTIRGRYDTLFWGDRSSPRLDGAVENVVLPTDHDGVRDTAMAIDHVLAWTADGCDA